MKRLPRIALVREETEADAEMPEDNRQPLIHYSAASFSRSISAFNAAAFASTSSTI